MQISFFLASTSHSDAFPEWHHRVASSSSNIDKYPPRLYEEGKDPIQNRSMNHYCYLSKFKIVREGIGEDVWASLKDSSVGVFLKFADEKYIWAAQNVHYFLTHQLEIKNNHEIWSLIDGRPIRFSLHEFADITGLNCDQFDPLENSDPLSHFEFWNEMEVYRGEGPTFCELVKVLAKCKTWSFEKRIMLGRLCILSIGIHGIHHGSRIPFDCAKKVINSEDFEKYPWGRVGFTCLVNSIKNVQYKGISYTLQGCVHALLIWVYESVHGLGETYGFRRETTRVPLLNWQGSRKRFKFEDFIKKEKAEHGVVRVRHMVEKAEDEIFPIWSDSEENKDPKLENLINDIIHNRLHLNAWDTVKGEGLKKNKRKVDGIKSESDFLENDGGEMSKNKKKKGKEHSSEDNEKEKISMIKIVKMLEKVIGTIENFDKKVTVLETKVVERIVTLENEIKHLRERRSK